MDTAHSRSALLVVLLLALPAFAAEPRPRERDTAARVDTLFRTAAKDAPVPPLAGDDAFMRRVYLDLTGKLPSAEEVRQFVAEPSAAKRALLIDRLLGTEAYAVNWARYWRDVVSYHTPASGNY